MIVFKGIPMDSCLKAKNISVFQMYLIVLKAKIPNKKCLFTANKTAEATGISRASMCVEGDNLQGILWVRFSHVRTSVTTSG
jgi:hypothetical protein